MAVDSTTQEEDGIAAGTDASHISVVGPGTKSRPRDQDSSAVKRRCVSTACIACRRRKSKCDGNTPSCAACSSVYGTECIYDPGSDHRRKGVYKKDIDNLKTRNSTLQTLVQGILNYPEDDVPDLVRQIRTCESLDDVAETILAKDGRPDEIDSAIASPSFRHDPSPDGHTLESELSGKMGELRIENGSVKYIGGTSNLIFAGPAGEHGVSNTAHARPHTRQQPDAPITSWTEVTDDDQLFQHLMNMYFHWHYPYFTTLSRTSFDREFNLGRPPPGSIRTTEHCTPLLVNAMLALGCHFSSWPGARADPEDSATAGDHFFKEAKRLILEGDEHENPRLATVQALALMSVREAGCGREGKGWVYSGMSFRMACDMGLNVDSGGMTSSRSSGMDDEEIDARRVTFWGCFLFDKCWSNYLGRQPQLPLSTITMAKFDVFPSEDAAPWAPYTDAGLTSAHAQPARTRAVALQITNLCEISSDLLVYFYHPTNADKPSSKTTELKKLGEIHTRLEAWKKNLPKEMEAREGSLPPVLLMHMFFQLLYIHLFRPFLKYNQTTTPLPAHVSPQKLCTQAASSISKLLRLYKRTYGLRQICNIAVYIAHSACTIHLLNLPEKTAKRDISHGIRHLEEIGEGWLCARRTLGILGVLARRWKIDLPEEAAAILARNAAANTAYSTEEHLSYNRQSPPAAVPSPGASGRTNPGRSTTNGTSPSSNVVPRGVPSNLHSSPSNMYATTAMPAGSLSFPQTIPYATTQDMPQPYQAWQTSPTAGPVYSSPTMQLYPRAQELVQPPNKWLMDDQLGLADDFSSWPTETEASTFDGMNAPLDPSNLGINSQAFDGEGSNQWYGA